ncbi:MAG: glycoside hydrolase family 32 protein [Actinobacteria bacterium]|nr:glycoside hydrolase family 32 protein [Actinomycetota bacterium]
MPPTVADACRPVYHYSSGGWMNDVIPFHDGERLHVYFDHNPEAAEWTRFHWGHAVTDDLVHWSTLPVALSPRPDGPDGLGCWTGAVFATPDGYAAAYTGIRAYPPLDQTQCLARSDDLVHWEQSPTAIVSEPPPGYGECFRDPYVWRADDGGWRMIVGSTEERTNRAAVLSYGSSDLERWEFLGPLFVATDDKFGAMSECPELFPLSGRMVLVTSRGTPGLATTAIPAPTLGVPGELDADGRFVPDGPVTVFDPGFSYAAKSFPLDDRRVQFAWMRDLRDLTDRRESGWTGALSLPRDLVVGPDGAIGVTPAREVEQLRGRLVHDDALEIGPDRSEMLALQNLAFEAVVELERQPRGRTTFLVGCDERGNGGLPVVVDWDAGTLAGNDVGGFGDSVTVRIFADRSAVEVFALDSVTTLHHYELPAQPRCAVLAEAGAVVGHITAWDLAATTLSAPRH